MVDHGADSACCLCDLEASNGCAPLEVLPTPSPFCYDQFFCCRWPLLLVIFDVQPSIRCIRHHSAIFYLLPRYQCSMRRSPSPECCCEGMIGMLIATVLSQPVRKQLRNISCQGGGSSQFQDFHSMGSSLGSTRGNSVQY